MTKKLAAMVFAMPLSLLASMPATVQDDEQSSMTVSRVETYT